MLEDQIFISLIEEIITSHAIRHRSKIFERSAENDHNWEWLNEAFNSKNQHNCILSESLYELKEYILDPAIYWQECVRQDKWYEEFNLRKELRILINNGRAIPYKGYNFEKKIKDDI